jgi:hypothetical protein
MNLSLSLSLSLSSVLFRACEIFGVVVLSPVFFFEKNTSFAASCSSCAKKNSDHSFVSFSSLVFLVTQRSRHD